MTWGLQEKISYPGILIYLIYLCCLFILCYLRISIKDIHADIQRNYPNHILIYYFLSNFYITSDFLPKNIQLWYPDVSKYIHLYPTDTPNKYTNKISLILSHFFIHIYPFLNVQERCPYYSIYDIHLWYPFISIYIFLSEFYPFISNIHIHIRYP